MEETKNKIGLVLFLIVLILFVVGGYFAMNYFSDENNMPKEKKPDEEIELRIDTTRDYVYYENNETIIEGEEIEKMDVVLNFKGLETLNSILKVENIGIFNSVKYTKDMDLATKDENGNLIEYNENTEGIYSLNYREYEHIKYGNYVSLIVKDYSYDIKDGAVPFALKSYIVDITTGKIVSEGDILSKYSVTDDIIKNKVKERLTNTQTLNEDESDVTIDINGTLNNLNIYAIYINKSGKLEITFVVKTSQNNYNDSVELN